MTSRTILAVASDFAPSVEEERRAGIRVVRMPFPNGVGGVKLSLEQIAQRIREGGKSPKVMGWAMKALLDNGIDGRSARDSAFRKMSTLLDAVREATVYTPDPPDAELVKSAEAMLCLAPGLCVMGGDCDDQCVLLGSVLMSVGIPVLVIKQTFRPQDQEHVMIRAQDEAGNWIALDPSTRLPAGQCAGARQEFAMDPLNPDMIGLTGVPQAEFVGIGALPSGVGLGKPARLAATPSRPQMRLRPRVVGRPPRKVGQTSSSSDSGEVLGDDGNPLPTDAESVLQIPEITIVGSPPPSLPEALLWALGLGAVAGLFVEWRRQF